MRNYQIKIALIIAFVSFSIAFAAFQFSTSVYSQELNLGSITPELNEAQRLLANDGEASDRFGSTVDIDGNTAIIGALLDDVDGNADEGSAYIFVKENGVWTEQAKLTAPSGDPNDQFGTFVAVDGDTAIVGARFDDVLNSTDNKGAVYVFVRSGTNWNFQQRLTVSFPGTFPEDQLGHGVALDGDRIVAGAPRENSDRGAAYVFVRTGGVWSEEQKLIPSETINGADQYGYRTAISGNTLAVSAPTNSFVGEVFVFVFNGSTWVEEQKLTPSDGVNGDVFGRGLAIEGDTIVVGSHLDHVGSNADQGSAYVFTRSGTTWMEQQKLTASDGVAGDSFGFSVSISGDRIVAGASGHDFSPGSGQGTAYVFKKSGGTWTEERKLIATDIETDDNFGASVAIDGTTIFSTASLKDISASPLRNDKSNNKVSHLAGVDQGAVYVFDLLAGLFCHPVQTDLVSWWTGDGNSLDIRNRNDGTLQNGATFGTGKVGQGFDFTGGSEHISIPHNTNLNIQNSFSAEAWIFPRSYINDNGYFLYKGTTFGNRWLLNVENNGFGSTNTINVNINDTVGGSAASDSITLNQWHHVAFTYDGVSGTLKLYIDGTEVLTDTTTPQTVTNTAPVTIGNNLAGREFDGLVDEVLIYDRVISQSEIQASFNADGRGQCKPTATVNPSGLVGWWAGDGDAVDFENGADGTLLNGTGFVVGKVGQAFTFNNMNQFIEASDANLPMGSNPRTTEMWIKPNTNARVTAIYGTQTALSAFYPIVIGNNICIGRFSGGDQCGTTNIIDGNWHHIALTYDGASTTTLYLDGQVERIVSRSYNTTTNGGVFRIGSTFSGSSDSFDGEIDEISIYNRALTITEIQSIFDAGVAGKLKTEQTNASVPLSINEKKSFAPATSITKIGSATVTFSNATTGGITQQIPLEASNLPALTNGIHTGLLYDISTSASYTGNVDVCFNLPAFTTSMSFATLRVLHLENNVWENRTTTSDFSTRTLCSSVTSLSPFAIVYFGPTAAGATISGRVLTPFGRGIPRAIVEITTQDGDILTARSNHFGYYKFENVQVGQSLVFNVFSKGYQFQTQVVSFNNSILELNFMAEE